MRSGDPVSTSRSRRTAAAAAALLLLAPLASCAGAARARADAGPGADAGSGGGGGARPNVILFTGDDHSKLDAGCYGNRSIHTPALDSLAAHGLAFDACYTVTAVCCPSRAVLMTGQYPSTNGCFGLKECNADVMPLTVFLSEAGYHCGLVGKRHLAPWTAFRFEYAPPDPKKAKLGRDVPTYLDDVKGFFAHLDAEKTAGPYFLMVNFHDPHRTFPKPSEVPEPIDRAIVQIPPTLPDLPGVREEVAQYDDAVRRMDRAIGLCLDMLRKDGRLANTLIVYTSDHGAGFPFAKSTLYDAGLNVPFIMSWPGHVPEGKRAGAMVSFVDFAPTVLDLIGLPIPPGMQGTSFAAVVRGETDRHRDQIFGSHTDDYLGPSTPIRAVRTARLDYIYNVNPERLNSGQTLSGLTWPAMAKAAATDSALARRLDAFEHRPHEELYDVAADPNEFRNVAGDPARAADLAEMRARLVEQMAKVQDPFLAVLPFATQEQRAAAKPAYDAYLAYEADWMKNLLKLRTGEKHGAEDD